MFGSILFLLFLALIAPWIQRRRARLGGWLLALGPAALAWDFARKIPGGISTESLPWARDLGLELAFRLDGWGGLFALLVTGIGALVVLYASHYVERDLPRFQSALFVFMASMLGLVLADSLILLFVFWELTSLSSYLLIGHDHHRPEARKAALQALLVTGGGGLALLAGLVLLGQGAGIWRLSELLENPQLLRASPLAGPALLLILLGCFSKSAQWPFHFWLPKAMEAPSPASAYLHSSTMVKAGVYLLGRLLPVMGEHPFWSPALQWTGGITFLFGAFMLLRTSQAKRLLAYTTVSSLGLMVLLLGTPGTWAVKAVVLLLPAHALYKGALFLLAGALDHETGEKDLARMGGLGKRLPSLLAGGLLAALSMVGLIPFLGFIAKEGVLEALVPLPWPLLGLLLLGLILNGSAGLAAGLGPFVGPRLETRLDPHGPPSGLWLPPLLLGLLGLGAGMFAAPLANYPRLASQALKPSIASWMPELWHGFSPAFLLGLVALGGAFGAWSLRPRMLKFLYLFRGDRPAALEAAAMRDTHERGLYVPPDPRRECEQSPHSLPDRLNGYTFLKGLQRLGTLGPAALYDASLSAMLALAAFQTRLLQTGSLRHYIRMVLGVLLALAMASLWMLPPQWPWPSWEGLQFLDIGLGLFLAASVLWCVQARSRLGVVVTLGIIGYSLALIFLLFGAPDLAMTQFAVETLTVLLFVLTLQRLPRFFRASPRGKRLLDAGLAGGVGLVMASLTFLASSGSHDGLLKTFFLERSLPEAHGRNVVNVILVDFRGLDTLGEITVLVVVALGAYALLKLRLEPKKEAQL